MSETLNELKNQIRISLLEEGKNEVTTGPFKISVKGDDQIEIIELPTANLEQLKLPLATEDIIDHFDGS